MVEKMRNNLEKSAEKAVNYVEKYLTETKM